MATKLSVYNGALLELGERCIVTLSDNVEPRRLLDRVWDDGGVDVCLADGRWRFARRSVEISASDSVVPFFGYYWAFAIPDDFVNLISIYREPSQFQNLTDYTREGGFWFANQNTIFVTYVSNGLSYGGDMSLWSPDFARYVSVYFAMRICNKINQNREETVRLNKLCLATLNMAMHKDDSNEPNRHPPTGNLVASRRG